MDITLEFPNRTMVSTSWVFNFRVFFSKTDFLLILILNGETRCTCIFFNSELRTYCVLSIPRSIENARLFQCPSPGCFPRGRNCLLQRRGWEICNLRAHRGPFHTEKCVLDPRHLCAMLYPCVTLRQAEERWGREGKLQTQRH